MQLLSRLRGTHKTVHKKQASSQVHAHDLHVLKRVHGRSYPTLKQILHVRRILSAKEKRALQIVGIFVCIAALWFGWGVSAVYRIQVPAVGGQYIEAMVGELQLVNPLFASTNDVDRDVAQLVYTGLMRYDEQQELVGDLAESYTISEDKKTYTFQLRSDVLWHDEQPFTAYDVAFTLEKIQDPQVGSPLLVSFQGVKIDVIDDHTISLTLQEPFQPFLSSLTVGILPEHIWGEVTPERFKLVKNNIKPIGTGPFKFARLAQDETGFIFQYELARFDSYYLQAPYIEEFIFQFFGMYDTEAGAIQALREQKAHGLHFVPAEFRASVERKHIQIHTLQLPQYTALFFNQERNAALEELDVRKALTIALDKDRILRESLGGDGAVIDGPILPGFLGYDNQKEKDSYSSDEANTLLDETWPRLSAEEYTKVRAEEIRVEVAKQFEQVPAEENNMTEEMGVDDVTEEKVTSTISVIEQEEIDKKIEELVEQQLGKEINTAQTFYRQDKDGNILCIDIVTVDTKEYQQVAQLVAGFWGELGIKTTVTFVDSKQFSRDVLKTRAYDVLLFGIIIGSDPDQYPFWHSSQKDYPGLNLSQYVNREVDELLEDARETDDSAKREENYKTFERTIREERPAIFLYTPIYRYATSDHLHGVDVTRIFVPADRFINVSQWYIKTKSEWGKSESSS